MTKNIAWKIYSYCLASVFNKKRIQKYIVNKFLVLKNNKFQFVLYLYVETFHRHGIITELLFVAFFSLKL